jgi:hypothetical protein
MIDNLNNQTVAVGVLAMILAGIAWLVKQLFAMLPALMDRLDKQEERRAEALRELAVTMRDAGAALAGRIEQSNVSLAGRIEQSNVSLAADMRSGLAEMAEDLSDCVEGHLAKFSGSNGRMIGVDTCKADATACTCDEIKKK